MPRRGRGGRRQGTPGVAYPQRTDLNAARKAEFTGQPYGVRQQQADTQAAIPAAPPQTAPGPRATAAPIPQGPGPGALGDLFAPTDRPNEPLTAGAPFGPGPGPNPFTAQPDGNPEIDVVRELYRATGSPSLRELLESLEG